MNNRTDITDLRTALEVLRNAPGQLIETDVEVDPAAELAGVYRHVGAGGTVMRPTNADGPAMLFHNVKGHPGARAVIGVVGTRRRLGLLLGCPPEDLGKLLCQFAENPIDPAAVRGPAPCQQIVHRAEEPGFDLFRLVPAPTNTPQDAGPYITLGMRYATHDGRGNFAACAELLSAPQVCGGLHPAYRRQASGSVWTGKRGLPALEGYGGQNMTGEFCLAGQALGKRITARITRLDAGIAVLLTGGERSHIGASACAGPEGAGEVTLPGHREDVLCRQWAARLAEVSGTQVWVACGIHYDGLSRKGLEQVTGACDLLLEQAADILGKG